MTPGPVRTHRPFARLHGRPDRRLKLIRFHGSKLLRRRTIRGAAHGLGAAAVVLQEENERVVQTTILPQLCDDATDALVHAIHHGRVHFHATGFPGLVLDVFPLARAGGKFGMGRNEAERLHPCEPCRADRLVTLVVATLVLGDILLHRMHRPVGRGVGEVEEERLVRRLLCVMLKIAYRVVTDGVGVIELGRLVLGIVLGGDEGVLPTQGRWVVEAPGAGDGAVEAVESSLHGP